VHPPQVNPSVNGREHQLKMVLGSLMSCRTPIDDRSACNVFVARGLKLCYHIGEFCIPSGNPQQEESYLSANAIASVAKKRWHLVGVAAHQINLDRAQAYANGGRAVIAVRSVPADHGHVCLILPGEMIPSPKWGLSVPNSASFRLDDINGCYVGGPLSKAFGPDKKNTVFLYRR
jgi:hypothetical protein